ncbi:Fungal specific transcription factor domain-containing protein, partial [Cladophialophora immunda]
STSFHLLARLEALEKKSTVRATGRLRSSQASAEDAISESGVNLEDYAHRNSITPHSTGIPEEPTIEPDSVDGMGAIALSDNGEYYTHFGPSSNLALVHDPPFRMTYQNLSPRTLKVQYLPPEPEATALLQQYFGTVGLFSPCIQEDTILATYKELRRNDPHYASPPDAAMEVSQKCFQKALKLAIPETITYSDLETVQLLCLTTFKAAMQIGLHHTDSYSNLSLLLRETRKRTWFWCVVNDCLLSVHFGRPSIIQSALTKMDLPVDISGVFPAGGQSPSVLKSSLIYYNSIIRLSVLISPILAQIYDDNVGSHKNRTVFETYI